MTSPSTRPLTLVAGADSEPGTRELLLAAAVEAFSSSRYEGVSVREIERQANVNRGLVAHHFGSKDQLWAEAVDFLVATFEEDLARYSDLIDDLSPRERLRILLLTYVRFCAKHPEFFRLMVLHGDDRTDRGTALWDRVRPSVASYLEMTQLSHAASPERQAMTLYLFTGAAWAIFALPAHCDAVFGFDPRDEAFVDRFASAILELFLSSSILEVGANPS